MEMAITCAFRILLANFQSFLGGDYRILCVNERFLSLILLGGEILRAAADITCSQSWDYRLRSQKEQLLGKAECLANCSVCIGLLWGANWQLLFAG